MIRYELRKAYSKKIIFLMIFLLISLILLSQYLLKESSVTVKTQADYYKEYSCYDEAVYEAVKEEKIELINGLFYGDEEVSLNNELYNEISKLEEIEKIFKKIAVRKYNIKVFTSYKNWNTELKYSYDVNESYKMADTSIWNDFFKYPVYEGVAIIITIIFSIRVCTTDNGEGINKILYTTKAGKKKINRAKRISMCIFAIVSFAVCFGLQLLTAVVMGLDMKIMDVGLYQLEDFQFAVSYMTIGKYVLFSIIGHLLLNIMCVVIINLISMIVEKTLYIYIVTALFAVILFVLKGVFWINPVNLICPEYYFDNLREMTIGKIVIHKFFPAILLVLAIIAVVQSLAYIIGRNKKEIN